MTSAHLRPQDITSLSHCSGVILVHFSSSLFHSSVTGFLSHNFVTKDFQSGLDQDSGLVISLITASRNFCGVTGALSCMKTAGLWWVSEAGIELGSSNRLNGLFTTELWWMTNSRWTQGQIDDWTKSALLRSSGSKVQQKGSRASTEKNTRNKRWAKGKSQKPQQT